jgi:protoheme IX farnesyltransferase
MLPEDDSRGIRTSRRILLYSVIVMGASLLPALSGMAGILYLLGAGILGTVLLWAGLQVVAGPTRLSALRVLKVSVAYLPLLLVLMAVDKI